MEAIPNVATALDAAHADLKPNTADAAAAVSHLNAALVAARTALPAERWQHLIAEVRRHPVCARLHEDPLTRRSFAKPRGYQGDADLLDIIYNRDWRHVCAGPVTPLGEAIFQHTIECQAPSAVRSRRQLLAQKIDEVAAATPDASVLSVACGHLRELRLSRAMMSGGVSRFVGLDQDRASLSVVDREWRGTAVETIAGSIKALWDSGLRGQKFDFIYTAGLYDYLDENLAQRLTQRMFGMLHAGGRLLVANYQAGVTDVGYMEAFMDWQLIYRDRAAMERIGGTVPAELVASRKLTTDAAGAVLYLELNRTA